MIACSNHGGAVWLVLSAFPASSVRRCWCPEPCPALSACVLLFDRFLPGGMVQPGGGLMQTQTSPRTPGMPKARRTYCVRGLSNPLGGSPLAVTTRCNRGIGPDPVEIGRAHV